MILCSLLSLFLIRIVLIVLCFDYNRFMPVGFEMRLPLVLHGMVQGFTHFVMCQWRCKLKFIPQNKHLDQDIAKNTSP